MNELYELYPELIKQDTVISLKEGWLPLVNKMCHNLYAYMNTRKWESRPYITSIIDYNNAFRVELNEYDDEIGFIITNYEIEALYYCKHCGKYIGNQRCATCDDCVFLEWSKQNEVPLEAQEYAKKAWFYQLNAINKLKQEMRECIK